MKTIRDVDILGKKVFIRADLNVPLDDHQQITDDARIRAVLPSIEYALSQKSKIIIASHLGRPKGRFTPQLSLKPVSVRLSELLGQSVAMAPDCIGQEVMSLVDGLGNGGILLLENLRFHEAEGQNKDRFGKALAQLCDVFVNDAFAVSHRSNASVVSITEHAPTAAAGFLLKKELDFFDKAMKNPIRPLVAVIGGAKISSKLNALNNMLKHVDMILVGGAMANTLIKSSGCEVGRSMVEEDMVETARDIIGQADKLGVKFYLPVDVVIAEHLEPNAQVKNAPVQEIPTDWLAADIGKETTNLYRDVLQGAGTVIWNGPMGVFEMEPFSQGTFELIKAIAASEATSIVGGGETGSAVHKAGAANQITYISTGGGAFLTLMEGKQLVAVAALEKAMSLK